MNKKKAFIAVLLILALCFALSACGSDGKKSTGDEKTRIVKDALGRKVEIPKNIK